MSAARVTSTPVYRIASQPATATAWRRFERALAEALADLGEDEYLVVTSKRGNRYVQFAGEGAFGMRAEAVSNVYLDDDHQLSSDDYARLVALGWRAPTYAPDAGGQSLVDGSPNFYIDAAAPVPYRRLGALAGTTLRDVLRVGHPGQLEYVAFTREGASIRFPGLKIRQLPNSPQVHSPAPRKEAGRPVALLVAAPKVVM